MYLHGFVWVLVRWHQPGAWIVNGFWHGDLPSSWIKNVIKCVVAFAVFLKKLVCFSDCDPGLFKMVCTPLGHNRFWLKKAGGEANWPVCTCVFSTPCFLLEVSPSVCSSVRNRSQGAREQVAKPHQWAALTECDQDDVLEADFLTNLIQFQTSWQDISLQKKTRDSPTQGLDFFRVWKDSVQVPYLCPAHGNYIASICNYQDSSRLPPFHCFLGAISRGHIIHFGRIIINKYSQSQSIFLSPCQFPL